MHNWLAPRKNRNIWKARKARNIRKNRKNMLMEKITFH